MAQKTIRLLHRLIRQLRGFNGAKEKKVFILTDDGVKFGIQGIIDDPIGGILIHATKEPVD